MRYLPQQILPVFLGALTLANAAQAQTANVTIDATTTVRVVDNRMFGLNTATWDGAYTDAQTLTALQTVDAKFLRFPGGSTSDDFNWQTTTLVNEGTGAGATDFDQFATYAKSTGAQVVITTNYGTGTPAMAAAWVTYSNVTKKYGFKYWEVGNECYGTWEDDNQAAPHDPTTYGTRAVQYIQAMKAIDPTIKIGVVADASEDSYSNNYTKSVTNPVTNVSHTGFTPVMLATMKAAGVLPDFLIYHDYPQNPPNESDATLLSDSGGVLGWASAASELRTILTDYLGTAGNNIELLVTENNSVSYNPGKQTTSLVNGLYLADSLGALMQTEFNGFVWWDLHNGQETANNNGAGLYGWRQYGDYGIESPQHDHYPTYYVMKLLTNFARGGDKVVKATSDNNLLTVYSVLRANGSLSILVINKSPTQSTSATFTLTGYSPVSTANVYTYGMDQDNAAKNSSGSPDVVASTITDAGASFTQSFAPYSVTVLSLTVPTSAPTATSQPTSQTLATGSTVVFGFGATGSPTPTYQWYRNGSAIGSGTSATLVVNGATASDAGSYTCTATNASGSVTSNAAVLAIASTNNPGRLVNISCRATVGTGANILIAGFAVGGAGTTGNESLLIRASGPALAPFGVTGTLPDPELGLYSGSNVLGSNSGWAGAASITNAAKAVGAFAWSDLSSHDAALLEPLANGPYTVQISGQSGDTGVALAEVYDATAAGAYTLATPRIVNISARVQVGTGGNILIAGFAIGGGTSKTVLIRASGPALVPFGVGGTLPDPQLQLYSGTTVLKSNSGWAGNPQIAATAASVGAFGWSSGASKDSAILVTLPPGPYTAQVSGASGDTGIALVEVYEVP